MLEAHFGVPLTGAALNAINVRLDAETVSYILTHCGAKVVLVDSEFGSLAKEAIAAIEAEGNTAPIVIDVDDPVHEGSRELIGQMEYEAFLETGDPELPFRWPEDEWDTITVNYTSGTTGKPKGVEYHHRGAWLGAMDNPHVWDMPHHATYLWTLPMFHCNGWCFPWGVTAQGGTHVCLRQVTSKNIHASFADYGVDHLCGAPIIMNLIANAPAEERKPFDHKIKMMTAAASPPAAVLQKMADQGIEITHVYGLTEVYGPATICAWNPVWNELPMAEQAEIKSRQGVRYNTMEGLEVMDPETMAPVPSDGETMGEIMMRGNIVMKGYHKNDEATTEAFEGGWFHSGDLATRDPDGYIHIKDRSKDIIISGGENVSSVEVEGVLYKHPAVKEVAVVALCDEKWGEVPCAFIEADETTTVTEEEIIKFVRSQLAGFKTPKKVVFGNLPKTSTGKVQKAVLRAAAKEFEGTY